MLRAFADRRDAGRRLADRVCEVLDGEGEVVVLGLPRGGVPVAAAVAAVLGARLDILVVGKVGVPGHEELALAAAADDGTVVVNPQVQAMTGLDDAEVEVLADRTVAALAGRGAELRPATAPPAPDLRGRTVVVVDDGMATGATMRVALAVVRGRGARRVVAAVPVASREAAAAVAGESDRLVCLLTPRDFLAVGPWYDDFTQVEDREVRDLLDPSDL